METGSFVMMRGAHPASKLHRTRTVRPIAGLSCAAVIDSELQTAHPGPDAAHRWPLQGSARLSPSSGRPSLWGFWRKFRGLHCATA